MDLRWQSYLGFLLRFAVCLNGCLRFYMEGFGESCETQPYKMRAGRTIKTKTSTFNESLISLSTITTSPATNVP